jgi:protein-disulfide isomerase
VERIKAEVMQELRTSDFLQQQIDASIQAYVTRERESRAKMQAETQAKDREEKERATQEQLQNVRRFTHTRDHIYGNPDAVISLIEYSDFECPFCKRFHGTARALVDQSDGQVNWIYRHFPLKFHNPGAQKEAEASECAYEQGGDDAFWQYANTLYERTRSGGKGFALDQLTPLAEEQGLDTSAFQVCLDSEKFAARVKEDLDEGSKAGITGTPGNILLNNVSGDVVLKTGAHPLAVFKDEIKNLLPTAQISETEAQPDPAKIN